MSKYNRKKDSSPAAQTDEFVSFWQQAFEHARPYARGIGWVLIGFVVVVAGVAVGSDVFEHRAEGSTEAYGRVVRTYEAELITDDAAKETDKTTDPVTRYKTVKERAEAVLADIDKLDGMAKKNARLLRAGVLFDLERYEEARSAYVAADSDTTPLMGASAREGVALCFEQLGKLDEAIAAYEKVAPENDKALAFDRDRALFGIARLLEKKGDKKGAIERYKQIVALTGSSLHEDAQNRLAVLEGT
jgi:tetratricopeptide (TPR) repeat protein